MRPDKQKQMMAYLTRPAMARGGRIGFDKGGVAQVKAYVESLPKNTVVTRKLVKDFVEANDVNVNFENLFNKKRPAYVGNFIKDKSITVDPSYAASVGDTKKYKKAKSIIDDPKKLKEFLKYGNQKGVSIKDIRKKFNISSEEFYEGGLRELFDKDFQLQASKSIKSKTINNINTLLNDSEAASFLKKGQIVPDEILSKLNLLPGEAATATVRIGQIYGGNNFGVDDFKKIRKNVKASDKLFDTMNKFQFGNPYRSKLYRTSLELIDQQLGNEKGTFESLKKKASYILKKNKIKGFDINEIAGVTGTARTGVGEFSQFVDVLDSSLNQKQMASFQSAFSQARQNIMNDPNVFAKESKRINRLAGIFEKEYGVELPRIRSLNEVEKFYSPTRLKQLSDQGLNIKAASQRLGYTIQMPKGAQTIQEFIKNPNLKKFLDENPTFKSKIPGLTDLFEMAKTIPGDIAKKSFLKAGFKTLGVAAAPLVAYDTYKAFEQGKPILEALEQGFIGTDMIGGTKRVLSLTPEEREARSVVKQDALKDLNLDMPMGFGFIEGPTPDTDMTLQEAQQKMDAGIQRVRDEEAQKNLLRSQSRGFGTPVMADQFLAGGGIAKEAGDSSGRPPVSGPNPQGLLSLKNRVRNY